jgi:hypothetical protein
MVASAPRAPDYSFPFDGGREGWGVLRTLLELMGTPTSVLPRRGEGGKSGIGQLAN